MSEPDFKFKKVFPNGRYTKFDTKKREWLLFDADGNCLSKFRKLAWVEEENRRLK